MSEAIISLEGVSKAYRLFHSPRYRMIEALGLPVHRGRYDEFWPLRKISLQVRPGERLGLVGRNGAGKSTLLKLIAGLLQPTEGAIVVKGRVQALMELGTGFHPEFTGRENVLSSFAYQGVTGRDSAELLEGVLDFSELEEFIDKPVKTYSAGMYARLAFAASTAIRPEILIIDEILGAGDAYFAGKSAKRMRDLTAQGTTVLFVSHDMSAVQMICERAVWIERGRIVADGDPIEIGRIYAASIRKQEELRLRAINLKLARGDVSELLTDTESDKVFVLRFVSLNGGPPRTPVKVYKIVLEQNQAEVDHVLVGASLDDDRAQRVHILTAKGFMDWSGPMVDPSGHAYREFRDCRGKYRHAPFTVRVPLGLGALGSFGVRVEHGGADAADGVNCEMFDGSKYVLLGQLDTGTAAEVPVEQRFALGPSAQPEKTKSDFVYGTGSVVIEDVEFLNAVGHSQRVYAFGEALVVEIRWATQEEIQRMAFVVCVYGMDGTCVSQVVSPFFAATRKYRKGVVAARFDPLMIGVGDYVVSIAVFDGLVESDAPGRKPLAAMDRNFRIKIVAPDGVLMPRGMVVHPVGWHGYEDTLE